MIIVPGKKLVVYWNLELSEELEFLVFCPRFVL